MCPKITIAIDGYAACGKSTLAKALAKELNYVYIDSGAMYRATTCYFLAHQVELTDEQAIRQALENIDIHFENHEGKNYTFLNGENVEHEIRSMRISEWVSPVSAIPAVRRAMVKRQQELGQGGGIAMDGRDIGTVVFRDAELKIFMTADIATRTQRRIDEIERRGLPFSDYETVQNNLQTRDHIDSTRADSPLRKAEDAITIDNSSMSPEEQLNYALDLAKTRIAALKSV